MGIINFISKWMHGKSQKSKFEKKRFDYIDSANYKDNISLDSPMDIKIKEMPEINEKEKRAKGWDTIKDQLLIKYQIPLTDEAQPLADQLYGSVNGSLSSLSVFFMTDIRIVKQRYIEGGEKAIEELAANLEKQAFVSSPITATMMRRLLALQNAKKDGSVIETEIDIDGFTPNGRIEYALEEVNLDGQIIPARRKFSPRCEMTATPTEGFHVGPFVAYEDLYYCTKEEMEQMMSGVGMTGEAMINKNMERMENNEKSMSSMSSISSISSISSSPIMGKELCPHGTEKDLYCSICNGDIIVSPSRKKVIGIYLDVTGSMRGNKIYNAKIAVQEVLDKIPINSNIWVECTIFSTELTNNYQDIIPYGTVFNQETRQNAIEKISRLQAGGDTPLYQAINKFMDESWSIGSLDKEKIFFPYTYLIIVSDGEENYSKLDLVYKGKTGTEGFFAKLGEYRNAGLITEIIPFAYGEGSRGGRDIQLIKDLEKISGKTLINETDPSRIMSSLTGTVDSILYGSDKLRMMGIPVSKNKVKDRRIEPMQSM